MQLQHILIPTDFSGFAEEVVQQVLALAAREQAKVLLLHVLPGPSEPGTGEAMQARTAQWLRDLVGQAWVPVHTLVGWGTPATEICRVAKEYHIDLIAMSTHGRTGIAQHVMGSVADAVIRQAPCAVLILRAARAGKEGA
jgi:nucleotide-binding universal stress UspA family protein